MRPNRVAAFALAILWLGATMGPPAICQDDDRDPPSRPLRVVAYNVQFLPSVAGLLNKRPHGKYRADAIAKRLADCDIIGLNEVFDLEIRERIIANFKRSMGPDAAVVVPDSQHRSFVGVDSGLVLLSRYPIVESHRMKFGNDSRIADYGIMADGLAAKGAIHARIAVPTDRGNRSPRRPAGWSQVDVFLTHLESKDAARRAEQFVMLAEFIGKHADASRSALLLGDMNTAGNQLEMEDRTSQYHVMIGALRKSLPRVTDLWTVCGSEGGGTGEPGADDGGRRIDYIFLSRCGGKATLIPRSVRSMPLADPKVGYLSDHCAVEGVLEWGTTDRPVESSGRK